MSEPAVIGASPTLGSAVPKDRDPTLGSGTDQITSASTERDWTEVDAWAHHIAEQLSGAQRSSDGTKDTSDGDAVL